MSESFRGDAFERVVYFEHGASGTGNSKDDRLPIATKSDIMALNEGEVVEVAQVVIETAVAGATDIDIGDGTDADGYVDGSADLTLGTAGAYAGAGALLPDHASAAKDVAMAVTGTSTAGKFAVVLKGYRI